MTRNLPWSWITPSLIKKSIYAIYSAGELQCFKISKCISTNQECIHTGDCQHFPLRNMALLFTKVPLELDYICVKNAILYKSNRHYTQNYCKKTMMGKHLSKANNLYLNRSTDWTVYTWLCCLHLLPAFNSLHNPLH